MVAVMNDSVLLERVLSCPRPGEDNILAWYDHALGGISTNPRLMRIPLDDHLVHRGDGIFETLCYEQGRIHQLEAHVQRLGRSAQAIGLELPCCQEEIRELIKEVCLAGGEREGVVALFCGRGPGGFTLDVRECPQASLYIAARRQPFLPQSFWEEGVCALRTHIPAKQAWLSKIKSVNYLANVLMKKEALEGGAEFPLCFDEADFLAEGSTENVVLVDERGVFVVPELKNALVGTTLTRAMSFLETRMLVELRPVREDELYIAQEVILLGTGIDAVSVVTYNGKNIGSGRPGAVSELLRTLLRQDRLQHGELLGFGERG